MAPRSTTPFSGRGDRHRASEGDERTLGRVEGVRDAERDRLVPAGMSARRSEDERDVERSESLGAHLVAAFGGLADAAEIADDDALDALERTRLQELGAEPVEPVGRLVQVLDQDDAPVEARLQRSAAQAREHREVAP